VRPFLGAAGGSAHWQAREVDVVDQVDALRAALDAGRAGVADRPEHVQAVAQVRGRFVPSWRVRIMSARDIG